MLPECYLIFLSSLSLSFCLFSFLYLPPFCCVFLASIQSVSWCWWDPGGFVKQHKQAAEATATQISFVLVLSDPMSYSQLLSMHSNEKGSHQGSILCFFFCFFFRPLLTEVCVQRQSVQIGAREGDLWCVCGLGSAVLAHHTDRRGKLKLWAS